MMAIETKKISTTPESRLGNIKTYVDENGETKFVSLNDAIFQIAKEIVPMGVSGQNEKELTDAMTKIKRGLDRGNDSKTIIDSVSNGMGDNEFKRNLLEVVKNGIYAYSKNPQEFLNKEVENIRSLKYEDLSGEEAQGVLDRINTLSQLSDTAGVGSARSGSRLTGRTQEDYYDWESGGKPKDSYGLSEDVGLLQDIIGQRKEYAQGESDVQDYLTRLETEMPAETEALMAGETERALSQFRDVDKPYIQQVAGSKGQLRSGNVEDMLTTSALNTQSGLENMRVSLESSDLQFIGNAAYREKVRQLLKTSSDLSTSLEQERATALTEKSRAFQSSQSDLKASQDEKLAEQRYNQQLRAQDAQYRRQEEESNKNTMNQWIQTGAGIVGGIGGSYAGSKLASGSGTPKTTA